MMDNLMSLCFSKLQLQGDTMKFLILMVLTFFFVLNVEASVPYCNIVEIVDGLPTLNSVVKEFKKTEKLEISMKDSSANATAEWNKILGIYQITLHHGNLTAITIVEPPATSGFLNLQDGKRIFQAQCRFELN